MSIRNPFLKSLAKAATALSMAALLCETTFAQQPQFTQRAAAPAEKFVANELLIKYKDGMRLSNVSLASPSNLEIIKNFGEVGRNKLRTARTSEITQWQHVRTHTTSVAGLKALREQLLRDPAIESVEYNHYRHLRAIPNDPDFSLLWGMDNTGQDLGLPNADINAPEAWDIQTGSEEIIVGVIDTGIDYTHEDLAANMWVNPNEIPDNGIDDDDNGYIDDVHGYDFVDEDSDPMDEYGHGTHVAGTIAAVGNNGIGVAGVTWNAKLVSIKIFDAGGFTTDAAIINGILYANDMDIKVTNNSWGGGPFSQALLDAIAGAEAVGSLFVAAAGNSSNDNDAVTDYPSGYDLDNIIAVAALDNTDTLAVFSSYGATSVDIGAPGVNVYSTALSSGEPISDPSGYAFLNGTSMATPHVAGAVALIMAQYPDLSFTEIKNLILASSRPVTNIEGKTLTGGSLDLASALDPDSVAPGSVADLSVTSTTPRSVSLTWSAAGDDGDLGIASFYDVRYSTDPIDESNFDSAPVATWKRSSGDVEDITVTRLEPETTYYFAVKAIDNVGNIGAVSNVVSTTTSAESIAFATNFDSLEGWTISGTETDEGFMWHLGTHRYSSPTTALYYGLDSTLTYDTGAANFGAAVSPAIDLGSFSSAVITFDHFLENEGFPPFDAGSVAVSTDGGLTWTDVYVNASGTAGEMVTEFIDISAYIGQVIHVRFFFDTQDAFGNTFEGWVVDDLRVSGEVDPNGRPPVPVIAGASEITVKVGEPVVLDGSGSYDPDGDTLSFSWIISDTSEQIDGQAVVTRSFNTPGMYYAVFVVHDGINTEGAYVVINVEEVTADPAGPYVGNQAQAIQMTAVADPEAVAYKWYFGDGSVEYSFTPAIQHTYSVPGVYTVAVKYVYGTYESNAGTTTATVRAAHTDSFDGYMDGQSPLSWVDTNSAFNVGEYFQVATIDGNAVFGNTNESTDVHTHFVGTAPLDMTGAYEFSGKMQLTDETGGMGVTFFSQYPAEEKYYRLAFMGNDFRLTSTHTELAGDIRSGIFPEPGLWYEYRIQVEDTGMLTTIRARVWEAGAAEPTNWSISVTDGSVDRPSGGTVGLWATGAGEKYWDDIHVESMGNLPSVAIAPNTIGMQQADAEAALTAAGFVVDSVTYAYSNNHAEGTVIGQTPAAGTQAYAGEPATLVVSLGQQVWVEVPNVVDMFIEDVEAALQDAGLMLGTVTQQFDDTLPEGLVIQQSISAGEFVTSGTTIHVTIVVGAGSAE